MATRSRILSVLRLRSLPLLIALGVVASCSTPEADVKTVLPPASENTVRIYSSLPSKGTTAAQAAQIRNGIELAISERSRAGGWLVEHVALDNSAAENGEWTVASEKRNAQIAAEDASAVAYIGPYASGATAASLPITNRAGLLQIGVSATWPGLTQEGWNEGEPAIYYPTGRRNFARLAIADARQGELAAFFAARDGISSILVLSDGSSYSDGLGRSFSGAKPSADLTIVGSTAVVAVDAARLGEEVSSTGAEAVFYAPSTLGQAVVVGRALSRQAPETEVYLSDTALNEQLFEHIDIDFSRWHIVYNGLAPEQLAASAPAFARDYEGAYSSRPGLTAANAYDAARIVLNLVAGGAGRDREKVLSGFMAVDRYEGASGKVTFDERGDRKEAEMSGYRIRNGRFNFERVITAP